MGAVAALSIADTGSIVRTFASARAVAPNNMVPRLPVEVRRPRGAAYR